MMRRNPGASVGFSLAAAAVYAAQHGACEAEHRSTDEWRAIARDLKSRYGESLTPAEVRREMGVTPHATPGNQHARKHAQHVRVNYSADAATVARIREIGGRSFSAGVNRLLAHYDATQQ
jgi:hypothetical protein